MVRMTDAEWLVQDFEEQRPHLRAVAYRMLGSAGEADDAVQEAWLRLSRVDASKIENLGGWLTTVVARVCLNMLRNRRTHTERDTDIDMAIVPGAGGPEDEALLADSVGLALLVVLDTLAPAERLAFVLHDMFSVPFDEIAPIVGRSPDAARQLASRARRRVQGADRISSSNLSRQREVVDAFLAAARQGDFEALVAVLDPDVVLRADGAGAPGPLVGAAAVASGASQFAARARAAQPAIVNGAVGLIVAARGRLLVAMSFGFSDRGIATVEVVTDQERLRDVEVSMLPA
jgi:RNA polymerase sigma factor (sigma-70 family)